MSSVIIGNNITAFSFFLQNCSNQALCDKDTFLSTLRENITTVTNRESNRALTDIDKQLGEMQTEL